MLILLAPAKTMDFTTSPPFAVEPQHPVFLKEATVVADTLKNYNEASLARLMKISPAIAKNVRHMYQTWQPTGLKPALWAYKGDVYKGVKADLIDVASAQWAQQHIIIMSGLYGVVRPFDMIAAYRLEMKAALKIGDSKDLYAFWGDKLGRYVAEHADGVVCVLSSDEYASPVTKHLPKNVRIVTPVFYDNRPNGTVGVAPIYSKMMRGVMARWMIDVRAETPEALQNFTGQGYYYDAARSTPDRPAFYREVMKPLVF